MNFQTPIPSYDVRNAFRDPRSAFFQDDVRKAMQAETKRFKPQPHSPSFDAAPSNRALVRDYLAEHGSSTRSDIHTATGLAVGQIDSAIRHMRERDHVTGTRVDSVTQYRLTDLGKAALLDPEPEPGPADLPLAVKLRLAPPASVTESVFDFILMSGPTTRIAIMQELRMSEGTLDNVFRTLRREGRLTAVTAVPGRKHTYTVTMPADFKHGSKTYWKCAHEGLSMSEAARKLKVSVQAVADAAARYGLVFRDGRKAQ